MFQSNFFRSVKFEETFFFIFFLLSFTAKNRKGIENIRNHMLTSKAIALIFCDSSLINPKGRLSVSINYLILISNITIPPIYPRAKPKPEDLPKFLSVEISFSKEL